RQDGPHPEEIDPRRAPRVIAPVPRKIRNVDEALTAKQPVMRGAWTRAIGRTQKLRDIFLRNAPQSDCVKMLAIIGRQKTECRFAETHRFFEHRVEDRCEVAGRAVDDVQHLGQRRFPRRRRVALGAALVEPSLQLGVGAPKIGGFVIEDPGHLPIPLRAGPSCMLLLILRSTRRRPRTVARRCTLAARARVDGGTRPETRMCGIISLAGGASPSRSANPYIRRYTLTLRATSGSAQESPAMPSRGITSGPRCGASAPISPDADRAIVRSGSAGISGAL